MKNLELTSLGLEELDTKDALKLEGGVIPFVAIGIGWGIMAACSAIALGMKEALNEHNKSKKH